MHRPPPQTPTPSQRLIFHAHSHTRQNHTNQAFFVSPILRDLPSSLPPTPEHSQGKNYAQEQSIYFDPAALHQLCWHINLKGFFRTVRALISQVRTTKIQSQGPYVCSVFTIRSSPRSPFFTNSYTDTSIYKQSVTATIATTHEIHQPNRVTLFSHLGHRSTNYVQLSRSSPSSKSN